MGIKLKQHIGMRISRVLKIIMPNKALQPTPKCGAAEFKRYI